MPESNIDITLRTKREGTGAQDAVRELEDMRTGLSDVEKSIAGTRTTIGNFDRDISLFGTNVGTANDFLNGMGIAIPVTPMQLFGQAVGASAGAIRDAIGDYSNYVLEVAKLSDYTGASEEDASKIIQIADDFQISYGTMEQALKNMAQNGIEPSIGGLGQLADKYLEIKDPVARARFLTEMFGRAGVEMGRMMSEGSKGIEEMAGKVDDYMIVTGESREEAMKYIKAMDDWEDAIMGVKYKFSSELMPIITDVINAQRDLWKEVENSNTGWMNALPILASIRNAYLLIKNLFNGDSEDAASEETYGGGRAQGGPVGPGRVYKVGEREVEYVQVGGPGMVTPASAGGGVQINLTYSPVVSLASRAEAEQVLVPYIQAALRQLQ